MCPNCRCDHSDSLRITRRPKGRADPSTERCLIRSNIIGLDATGTTALPNGNCGIQITGTAGAQTLGGTAAAARNVVSGNAWDGTFVDAASATGTVIQGNVISGNAAAGVRIQSGSHALLGNIIGRDAANTKNVPNGSYGVRR